MIVIVDTGIANRWSVKNAFDYIGHDAVVSNDPQDIRNAQRLVLPGVGAFGAGMAALREQDLDALLSDEVLTKGKPILGVCLGMQMMVEHSDEGGGFDGLNWIPGQVKAIEPNDPDLKVPHIGFNTATFRQNGPYADIVQQAADFYFVHSFYVDTAPEFVLATFEHGGTFTAAIAKDNILAVQFHPEKSQTAGLDLLKNFATWE